MNKKIICLCCLEKLAEVARGVDEPERLKDAPPLPLMPAKPPPGRLAPELEVWLNISPAASEMLCDRIDYTHAHTHIKGEVGNEMSSEVAKD